MGLMEAIGRRKTPPVRRLANQEKHIAPAPNCNIAQQEKCIAKGQPARRAKRIIHVW